MNSFVLLSSILLLANEFSMCLANYDEFDDLEEYQCKEFRQKALELHNYYRAKHCTPLFELNEKLNQEAQDYAEHEAKTNIQRHSCGPCNEYGENLAYKAGTAGVPEGIEAAEWACKIWYDEISHYNFKKPGEDDFHKWSHFTALIWKGSKQVGFGVGYGTKFSLKTGNLMKTVYVVARYLPAGNIRSPLAMEANVLPPIPVTTIRWG